MTEAKFDRWPSLRLYEKLGVPYMVVDGWSGPLWTGTCMVLDVHDTYGDEGYLHELFHWLCASKEQRKYADLALGRNVNATDSMFTASDLPVYDGHDFPARNPKAERTHNPGWGEQTVTRIEASRQEDLACHAMWMYAPIVGLCSWEDTPEPAHAAGEFADYMRGMPSSTQATWAEVKKVILSKLCPGIPMSTIRSFIARQQGDHATHGSTCPPSCAK